MKPTHQTRTTGWLWLFAIIIGLCQMLQAQTFVHPGGLHTQADFDRMAANVAAGNHPWIDSYNKLTTYSQAQTNWGWAPVPVIYRCGSGCVNNFSRSQQDALAIYYNALRYRITGDVNFANHAIQGMDAWSGTCTNVSGDSNWALAAGLCGYEFACAGEVLHGYSGWSQSSINAYSNFLETVFIAGNNVFLTQHNGTCDTHYRCNWDCCNMASMIAGAVFCDDVNSFNQAIAYYTNGVGNGDIERAVLFVHPDGLGQCEESGRDQAHCMDGFNSLSTFCQVAWNQGVDMYGYDNNRYLRGLEYIAKYNVYNNSWVPYVHHRNCLLTYDEASVWGARLGVGQYFWETPFAHYANVKGIAAPYTGQEAALSRPDGGISDWNSPDWFGFTTLTSYRGPVTNSASAPSGLVVTVSGQQITLNWWGTALATSYNVKRATTSGGPYTTVAVTGPFNASYVDPGLTPGATYYYVVSANQPDGETANSAELAASPNDIITGTVIGSPGSYNNTGATIVNAFDNSFESFYDATNATGDWTGIDPGLGVNSVGSVITGIDYAPRSGFASRMVGGQFQGALDGDPNFTSPVTLYTVTTQPTDGFITAQNGILTPVTINNTTAFRYLRYLGPANANCNVSQIIFHGDASGLMAPSAPVNVTATVAAYNQVNLSWNASAGATSYAIKRATSSSGPYMIIEYLASTDLTALNSNTNYSDYSAVANTTYYYVVSALNSAGQSASSAQVSVTMPVKLTGTIIGTPGSWNNLGNTITNVFDNDLATYFDGPDASGDWAGLDLGTSNVITWINYCPRPTFGSRMTNGVFQGANDPNFTAPVTLFTITAVPPDGVFTSQAITDTGSYRYVRYLGPSNGYCNVAEVAFYTAGGTPTNSLPAAPTALSATAGNAVVNLGWTQSTSSGITGNNVYRSTTGSGGPYNILANLAASTSYSDNAVTNGSTYFYSVTAVNANGESALSVYAGATPEPPPPAAPTGLTATAASSSQINLSWTASSGATSYNVKRATASGGPYTTIASGVTATSYSDTGLSGGTTYYYVVSAVNGGGESANSTEATTATIPAAPTGLSATAGNSQVALSWSTSTGAASYNVKRATVSGGPYTTLTNATTTSYTDATAVNGTTYYYVVSALNSSGESANSSEVSATPSAPAVPTAPTGLSATAPKHTSGQIKLSWTQSPSPNITNNKVYRSTTNGGPYALVTTLSATTSYTDTGLTSGMTYYYVVTAVNSSGLESSYSTQASATSR